MLILTAERDGSFRMLRKLLFCLAMLVVAGPAVADDAVRCSREAGDDTLFGAPTFTSSPVSSALRLLAGGGLDNTYSSTSENEAYNSWSTYFTNSGHALSALVLVG
jgi:hypothetical protein